MKNLPPSLEALLRFFALISVAALLVGPIVAIIWSFGWTGFLGIIGVLLLILFYIYLYNEVVKERERGE